MVSPGGRFNASNLTAKQLIEQAYGVRDFQLSGAPGWADSEHYDIEAKADTEGPLTREQIKVMVQALLADRFQLKIHKESKELPMYALVVGKNGPKLKESTSERSSLRLGRGMLTAEKVSVEMFAGELARQVGRSITDKTGLKGNYDFKLEWTPDASESFGPNGAGPGPGPGGPDAPPPPDPNGPTLFTAVQEQLGLKLESTKGPVEILVIDHIDRPSAN